MAIDPVVPAGVMENAQAAPEVVTASDPRLCQELYPTVLAAPATETARAAPVMVTDQAVPVVVIIALVDRVAAIGPALVPTIDPTGTIGTIGGGIIGPTSTTIGITTGTTIGMASMVGSGLIGGRETIGVGILIPA